ncbi:hypothetical protein [Nocardia sp. NPDC058666]|uniref:hypothetical protein n=1 Tax=Nocardia sp. NPDC058666 TaxID=3346587 RepID=UPI00365B6898
MSLDRHDPRTSRIERVTGPPSTPTAATPSHMPVHVPYPPAAQQLSSAGLVQVDTGSMDPVQVDTGAMGPARIDTGALGPVRADAGSTNPARVDTATMGPVEVDAGSAWPRRTIFRFAAASAIGIPTVAALAACAEDDTVHAPDPLAAQEVLARADAAAATAAIALAPQSNTTLATIATERTAHADALRTEIDRVIGVYGDGTTPVRRTGALTVPGPDGSPVPATQAETAAQQPVTITQLRDQLVRSQQSAATLAATESGYRAGLLASISAACATQAGVLLT